MNASEWHFREAGEGSPLLLIHGLGANSFSWRDNLGPLSARFRVLAPDLPGHGLTPAAATPDFRLETLAGGLLAFLERRGVERCAVAGNSLGGGLSLLLARERPGRFGSLVLLAPAAAVTQVPWLFLPLRLPVVLALLTWPMMALGWVTNLLQRGRALAGPRQRHPGYPTRHPQRR